MATKSKTVTVGGQTSLVKVGSKADKELSAQSGAVSSTKSSDIAKAKSDLKAETKARSSSGKDAYGVPLDYSDRYVTEEGTIENPKSPLSQAQPENLAAGTMPGTQPGTQPGQPAVPNILPNPNRSTTPVTTPAATPTPTQNKYTQAASGLPGGLGGIAPSDGGEAMSTMSRAMAPTPDTSVSDSVYAENPELQSLLQLSTEYFSPKNQKDTLLSTYKKLYKDSNLEELDEDIIDAKTIIEGTEDDIRNEIQMAGGTGTDSQIQAMALSRNKSLLKNYNNLVAQREQAQNHLDMMMNLSSQDRQMADQRFGQQISVMTGLANFRQQALNNTREQYRWMAQNMGADGLYNSLSQDPRQLAAAEKILGTGPGGLQKLAQQAAQQRALETQKSQLELASLRSNISTDAMQRAKIGAEIAKIKAESAGLDSKSIARTTERVNKASGVVGKISEATKLINNMSTGLSGGLLRSFPGTSAYTLDKTLTTIKANLGFDELQKMREASPTGGALGQVAVQELEALQSTIASLDTGLPGETLKSNLGQIQTHYRNWLNTVGYELAPDGTVIEITD